MSPISPMQIRALQAARRAAGITDDDWRARLARDFRVTSTKDLSSSAAGRLLDEFRSGSKAVGKPLAAGAKQLTGPFAPKLRALWITGWQLGVVHDRTDKAMLAFVERQTGIENTRFLRDAGAARAAIEGLKAWIGREAKFDWPTSGEATTSVLDDGSGRKIVVQTRPKDATPAQIKRAVIRRMWFMLVEAGNQVVSSPEADMQAYAGTVVARLSGPLHQRAEPRQLISLTGTELDAVAQALAAKLREYRKVKATVAARRAARRAGA